MLEKIGQELPESTPVVLKNPRFLAPQDKVSMEMEALPMVTFVSETGSHITTPRCARV